MITPRTAKIVHVATPRGPDWLRRFVDQEAPAAAAPPVVAPQGQVLGRRTDHAYSKGCDCSTCEAVRVQAREVRAKATAAFERPLLPQGSLVRTRAGEVLRVAIAGRNTFTLGTLRHTTSKAERRAARKAEKKARRQEQPDA